MLAISYIDGRTVPSTMSLAQIHALLPQGIAGLHSVPDGEAVFPNEAGVLHLQSHKHYSLLPSAHGVVSSPRPLLGSETKKRRNDASESLCPKGSDDAGAAATLSVNPSTALHGIRGGGAVCTPLLDLGPHGVTFPEDGDLPRRGLSLTRSFEPRQGKLILDRVHEHLMLPLFVFDIIDTPEFQRLRGLKQLGMTSYLYPGATHTRFEHSIGVAHLAGLMVKKIARRQPELNITDEDILCVTVAGLCHDLGHGPFSHLFESIVNRFRGSKEHWHHESMSTRLLYRVLQRQRLSEHNLTEDDARFIALCIHGLKPGAPWPNDVGRPVEKRFLLDIVSNKRSGIDVDKLDYFLRDSLCCYGRTAVDCHIPRLLASCKVLCFEREFQICYEEKLALSLGDIFTLRAKLHKYAYQHRIVKVLDHMITDALLEADPYFTVRGTSGTPKRISECVEDEEAFIQLGDWIIDAISASTDRRMEKAQSILRRIRDRRLYTVVGMAMFARHQYRTSTHIIKDELLQLVSSDEVARKLEDSLIVDFVKITYGSSDSEGNPDDPINNVTFYNPKSTSHEAFKLPRARQSPLFSPSEFGEKSVMIIVRDSELTAVAAEAFRKWREGHSRALGVEVPVYNMSPGHISKGKRAREGLLHLCPTDFSTDSHNAAPAGVTGSEVPGVAAAPVPTFKPDSQGE